MTLAVMRYHKKIVKDSPFCLFRKKNKKIFYIFKIAICYFFKVELLTLPNILTLLKNQKVVEVHKLITKIRLLET